MHKLKAMTCHMDFPKNHHVQQQDMGHAHVSHHQQHEREQGMLRHESEMHDPI